MPKEEVSIDPLAAIEEALASPKVDPFMAHQFALLRDRPDFNAEEFKTAFLARVRKTDIEFEGRFVLSAIGNILAMQAPYSAMPGIVENKDVLSIEASRPAGPME